MDNKKLYKTPDKKLAGVCGGLADYFNIDPTLVRLVTFILSFFSLGTVVIIYFVMAIALENPPEDYFALCENTSKKITKSRDRKISGVCGGLAAAMNIDPVIVRLGWALLTAFSVGLPGIITYFVASLIMPEAEDFEN